MSRICMVVQSYYLRDGRVRREAESLFIAGHELHVICLKDKDENQRQIYNGVRIYRMPLSRKRSTIIRYIFEYSMFFALASIALIVLQLRRRYDIVYIHTLPDFLVFVGLLPRCLGAKIVLDVHDLMLESFISKQIGDEKHPFVRLLKWIERKSFQFPDHIVTIHDPYADFIARRSGRLRTDITAVMNLADEKIFKDGWNKNKKMRRRPINSFILIYSGTVAKRYGIDTAIRAVPNLSKLLNNFKFIILGEGENKKEFENLAQQIGVKDYVEFRPPIPIDDVPGILSQADAGISPHVNDINFRWSFPQKVYEYLYMGLPVVSTRTYVLEHYFGDSIYYSTSGDPDSIVDAVLSIYFDWEGVLQKMESANKLINKLNWMNEKKKLASLVVNMTQR